MADADVGDLDGDVVGTRLAAGEGEGHHLAVLVVRADADRARPCTRATASTADSIAVGDDRHIKPDPNEDDRGTYDCAAKLSSADVKAPMLKGSAREERASAPEPMLGCAAPIRAGAGTKNVPFITFINKIPPWTMLVRGYWGCCRAVISPQDQCPTLHEVHGTSAHPCCAPASSPRPRTSCWEAR